MNNTIQTLNEFVEIARKNRKYPDNTALAIKSALKLFEIELTDQERESLDVFKEHLEQVSQSVFNKNKAKISASSLATYKRRIANMLDDYEKYGTDPAKMASWSRPIRGAGGRSKVKTKTAKPKEVQQTPEEITETIAKTERFELVMGDDQKAILIIPTPLTAQGLKKIRALVDYLEATTKEITEKTGAHDTTKHTRTN